MVLKKYELEAKLKDDFELVKSGVLREENPLDQSDGFKELLDACRRGDQRRSQELISSGVNINGKDKFDYTPLILASLCGHYELVEMLLESGALAERDTFQGERCIYNALNNKIRNLLLEYDYSKSTDPLQPWAAHITSLLTRDLPKTSDISVPHQIDLFSLHKFLLSVRSPYFQKKLAESPETTTWKLPETIPFESFSTAMRYLYLGDIPKELVDARSRTSEEEVLHGIDKISKHLEIETLWEIILAGNDRRLARQRHQDEVNRAQKQVEGLFEDKVLGHKMIVDTAKVQDIKWPHNNAMFADCLLRADQPVEEDGEVQEKVEAAGIPIGPGASGTTAEGTKRPKSVVYPVHKAMLIRSPYFETMFSSQFLEAQPTQNLHILSLDCTPEVLEIVLRFLYTENTDIPLDLGLDLLYISDMLFLDKLKSKAAVAISTLGSGKDMLVDRTHTQEDSGETEVEPINVYDVIHAAWDLRVQRLESFAARYIAYRLEDYIDEPEFADLIQESASRLKTREETDTIELLDDIRYYLPERFRLRFEDAGLEQMLDEKEEGVEADPVADGDGGMGDNGAIANGAEAPPPEKPMGVMRTLDGQEVDDEFSSDAINYQVLLQKIDGLLDRLNLDA